MSGIDLHYHSRMPDSSRRQFLQAVAAGAAALPFAARQPIARRAETQAPRRPRARALHAAPPDGQGRARHAEAGEGLGLQGRRGRRLPGKTAAEFKALLGQYGLRMQSMLTGYEKLRDDARRCVKDAKDMGCSYVGTAWIPHQGPVHAPARRSGRRPTSRSGARRSAAKACSSSTTCTATSSARRPTARCSTR